jgi:hypothetical protein
MKILNTVKLNPTSSNIRQHYRITQHIVVFKRGQQYCIQNMDDARPTCWPRLNRHLNIEPFETAKPLSKTAQSSRGL